MLTDRLKRYLSEPLAHFLLIGVSIYALYTIVGSEEVDDERTITITADQVAVIADQFVRAWGRPPTSEELDNLIHNRTRVQVLYREALAMRLDDGDNVIERRLAQKLELLARGLITPPDPTDDELKTFFRSNTDSYWQPDLFTITQVFFNPDQHGDGTRDVAQNALTALRALADVPTDAHTHGDLSMLPNHLRTSTQTEIASSFGATFSQVIAGLQAGEWHGPVASGFGTHLVYIHDIIRPAAPDYETIKSKIRDDWIARRIDEFSEQFVDELASRYVIIVEDADIETVQSVKGAVR